MDVGITEKSILEYTTSDLVNNSAYTMGKSKQGPSATGSYGDFSSDTCIVPTSPDVILTSSGAVLTSHDVASSDTTSDSGSGREAWGGQVEYLLTCVSYAVGLGNVWRFPYLAYSNGGGAFLIPYIITLVLVGIPLYFLELSFGQFASSGPVTVWTVNPLFKGVGMASVVVATYITLYFNVILSWCFYYLFASMQAQLPWTGCNNTWNTALCRETVNQTEPEDVKELYKSPTEEYFYHKVLGISSGIDDFGSVRPELAGFLLLSWAIVFLVLIKGINSLGKVSYVVSILPYIVLTILLGRAATLPGALDGVKYYIVPQWHRLKEVKVWTDAATQIFYSVGVCLGCLVTMGSYNKFKNNTLRDSLIIPPVNCLTSIYSGFVIFSVLGYMAHEKQVPIDKVAADGPGLVFVVYPEALAAMPIPQLWSVLFFVMLCLIGFGSIFSQAETAITSLLDQFPETLRVGNRHIFVRLAFCVIGYLITLPMVCEGGFYLFKIVNDYSAGYQLLVIALLEVGVLMIPYGLTRFSEDIEMMLGRQPPLYFKLCWCLTTPVLILAVLVTMIINEPGTISFNDRPFPSWSMAIAWLLVFFPIGIIFFYMVARFLKDGGWKAVKKASAPRRGWGPANPRDRTGRYLKPETDSTDDSLDTESFTISSGDMSVSIREADPPAYERTIGETFKF